MKKIFLVLLMVFRCTVGGEFQFDLQKILTGVLSSSDHVIQKFVDSLYHQPRSNYYFGWIDKGNVDSFIYIAMKGINVRNSEVRAESLKVLNIIVRYKTEFIQNDLEVRQKFLDCALKGFNDEYGSVQSNALKLLRSLAEAGWITGSNTELVRAVLESKKCYVQNLQLYQDLFEKLFFEELPIDVLAAQNNITPEEVGVEFNIALRVLNDKKVSFDKRDNAFGLLKLLLSTGLLNENAVDQFLPVVLKELIKPQSQNRSIIINIIAMDLGLLFDKPERLNQVIAVCCKGVTSHDANVRINCLMILMWLVDNFIITTDHAARIVEAMKVGEKDSDKYVKVEAFELKQLLYKKGVLKRGMLARSVSSGNSSKFFLQQEPFNVTKFALERSGINPESVAARAAGSVVSST